MTLVQAIEKASLSAISAALHETGVCPCYHFLEKASNRFVDSLDLIFVTSNELEYEKEENQTRLRYILFSDGHVSLKSEQGVGEPQQVIKAFIEAIRAIDVKYLSTFSQE
jgi:hypothetical protein